MKTDRGIYFEVHGSDGGIPLFLGYPLMASHADIFGSDHVGVLDGFLSRLTDRYQVIVADYPGIGRSDDNPPEQFTVDRALTDLLSVADAAGFEKFAWWGYAWGAIMGLQLATRTDRVTALACGKWPPLGGAYDDMLSGALVNAAGPPPKALTILRHPEQYVQWITFYESMRSFDETAALQQIGCPRLVFVAAADDASVGGIQIRIGSTIQANRAELERLGWQVAICDGPGGGLGLGFDAAAAVPLVRDFLDHATDASTGR